MRLPRTFQVLAMTAENSLINQGNYKNLEVKNENNT